MGKNSTTAVVKSKNDLDKFEKKVKKPKYALYSIIAGFLMGFVILGIFGYNPIVFFTGIFTGSFGSAEQFGTFLANLAWLTLVGLSVGLALKMGMFNIGVTSQFMLGGITGFFWAYYANIGAFGVVFSILIPMLSGALLGWLIGYLKAKHNVNEVLTSIMFNWIVYYLYKWASEEATGGWLSDKGTNAIQAQNSLQTDRITNLFGQNGPTEANMGIWFAVVAVIVIWFLLKKTQWGTQVTVTGQNKNAAVYAGYNKDKNVITTMTISGALAGLAGAIYYLGMKQGLPKIGTDLPGEAFNGISIALIGFTDPIGMFVAAAFIAMINSSQIALQVAGIPTEIITIVNALIILSVATVNYFIIYDPIGKWKTKNMARLAEVEAARSGETPQTNLLAGQSLKSTQNKKSAKVKSTQARGGDK